MVDDPPNRHQRRERAARLRHRDLEQSSLNDLYCNLMEDTKRRSEAIHAILAGRVSLARIVAMETCYLQLRKICELIARACLAAHGELPETRSKSLSKEYSPEVIIKRLSKLHPGFYPWPEKKTKIDEKTWSTTKINDGYLTKTDLLKLYGEAGDFLHEPTLSQRVAGIGPNVDFARISFWMDKIKTLLNEHAIQLVDPNKQLRVIMQSDEDGKVHAFQFLRRDESPPPPET